MEKDMSSRSRKIIGIIFIVLGAVAALNNMVFIISGIRHVFRYPSEFITVILFLVMGIGMVFSGYNFLKKNEHGRRGIIICSMAMMLYFCFILIKNSFSFGGQINPGLLAAMGLNMLFILLMVLFIRYVAKNA